MIARAGEQLPAFGSALASVPSTNPALAPPPFQKKQTADENKKKEVENRKKKAQQLRQKKEREEKRKQKRAKEKNEARQKPYNHLEEVTKLKVFLDKNKRKERRFVAQLGEKKFPSNARFFLIILEKDETMKQSGSFRGQYLDFNKESVVGNFIYSPPKKTGWQRFQSDSILPVDIVLDAPYVLAKKYISALDKETTKMVNM